MKNLFSRLLMSICLLIATTSATPPACMMQCVFKMAQSCTNGLMDFSCICESRVHLFDCMADICPLGNFLPARDHYLGTCIERIPSLGEDPNYNYELPSDYLSPSIPLDPNDPSDPVESSYPDYPYDPNHPADPPQVPEEDDFPVDKPDHEWVDDEYEYDDDYKEDEEDEDYDMDDEYEDDDNEYEDCDDEYEDCEIGCSDDDEDCEYNDVYDDNYNYDDEKEDDNTDYVYDINKSGGRSKQKVDPTYIRRLRNKIHQRPRFSHRRQLFNQGKKHRNTEHFDDEYDYSPEENDYYHEEDEISGNEEYEDEISGNEGHEDEISGHDDHEDETGGNDNYLMPDFGLSSELDSDKRSFLEDEIKARRDAKKEMELMVQIANQFQKMMNEKKEKLEGCGKDAEQVQDQLDSFSRSLTEPTPTDSSAPSEEVGEANYEPLFPEADNNVVILQFAAAEQIFATGGRGNDETVLFDADGESSDEVNSIFSGNDASVSSEPVVFPDQLQELNTNLNDGVEPLRLLRPGKARRHKKVSVAEAKKKSPKKSPKSGKAKANAKAKSKSRAKSKAKTRAKARARARERKLRESQADQAPHAVDIPYHRNEDDEKEKLRFSSSFLESPNV